MSAITGLGVGGPARAYALFADKSTTALPADRITRLGVGGPMMLYNDGIAFGDKEEATGPAPGLFNYPMYCRTRKRR